MENNYQSRAFDGILDSIFPGIITAYCAMLAVSHAGNDTRRLFAAAKVYARHTNPSPVLSMHHGSYSIDDISLADKRSGDLFSYNFHDFQNRCNNLLNNLLSVKVKDIFTMNSLYKRKKEVNDKKWPINIAKYSGAKLKVTPEEFNCHLNRRKYM